MDIDKQNDNSIHDEVRPNLPTEVCERIMGEFFYNDGIHPEDEGALKECALTCRLFSTIAQRLLFKNLEFNFNSQDLPSNKLLKAFGDASHIYGYVKRLTLSYSFVSEDGPSAMRDANVQKLLSLFVNLRALEILGGYYCGESFHFLNLDASLQQEITFKCRSLVRLSLRHLDFVPLDILENSHILKDLEIFDVFFIEHSESLASSSEYSGTLFSRLQRMNISGALLGEQVDKSVYPFFLRGRHNRGFDSLEFLSIDMDNGVVPVSADDYNAVKWIINNSAKSLKVLNLTLTTDVPVSLDQGEKMFDVSTMPLLEEFTLTGAAINQHLEPNITRIDLNFLSRHIEIIPTSRIFKKITLHTIILTSQYVSDASFDDEGLQCFQNLVLTVLLPQTSSLSLKFNIWGSKSDEAKSLVEKHLFMLHEKDMIKFTVSSKRG